MNTAIPIATTVRVNLIIKHCSTTFLTTLIGSLAFIAGSPVAAQSFSTLYSFSALVSNTNRDGAAPDGNVAASGNSLYGTTSGGGAFGNGTLFKVDSFGTSFVALRNFTPEGGFPKGLALSGNTLYGATVTGGASGNGTLYAVNIDGTDFRTLFSFSATDANGFNTDGVAPNDGLILSQNTLYGTTGEGGLSGNGTVFAIKTDGTGFKSLHSFTLLEGPNDSGALTNADGADSTFGLILSGGTLYGTTWNGGSAGAGTIFSVDTDGTAFKTLYSFSEDFSGEQESASLSLANNTLYGTVDSGTVFKVEVDGTGFTILHNFDDQSVPGSIVMSGGTLYGTTVQGGSAGNGAVFSLNPDGSNFTNVHSFTAVDPTYGTNTDGAYPVGILTLSSNTLYGKTRSGGDWGEGTLFSVSLSSVTPNEGSLRVTLAPSKAVSGGAKWEVDGNGVFETSGASLTNLSAGTHTVSFKPVAGWQTPPAQTVVVLGGGTVNFSGVYSVIDTTPPKVAITSPKAGQTTNLPAVLVRGTASDNVAVAAVYWQFYSQSGTNPWVLATGTTSWSAAVSLAVGTNYVRAYAVDSSGNVSTTNTSPAIVYQVLAPVRIGILGEGDVQLTGPGVSRNLTTTTVLLLGMGQNYTLDALPTPHSGFGFQGWSGSQVGTNPKIGFHSASNLAFTATFGDTQRPVDQIFYPKAKATVTDAMITVTGKASDNVGVTNVWLIVNGTNCAVTTLSLWTNWSAANVPLVPGANILQSFAADAAGNISLTNTVNCTYTTSDLAPFSIAGMSMRPASPPFTRTFDAGTYSETMLPGSNPDQNFVGNYTYTKLTANTATISGQRTSPPGNAYGSSDTAPGGQEAWFLNFTTKTTATLTFTNSDGSVKTAAVTFSLASNTAPDTVAGKTLRVTSHQGGGATEVLGAGTFAGGGTSGNADSGTYTFQRYSPVGGLLVPSWTAPAEQAGQVGYMALTFSSASAGTYYAERDDASGNETATDWGTFTLR